MRLSYNGYCLLHRATGQRFRFPLRGFLHAFCNFQNPQYKNSILYGSERLYLFPVLESLFLLVVTRSQELIKRIDTAHVSVSEIYDLLAQEDQIGFASYVYVRESFLGFGSTMFAPKLNALTHLVNTALESLGINDYAFVPQPLMHSATREELIDLPFIGRTTFEVEKNHPFAARVKEFFGMEMEDFEEIDSFQLTLKPRLRSDITGAARRVISQVDDEGLKAFVVKGKEELGDQLSELYLIGSGMVVDEITARDERLILEQIRTKAEQNRSVAEKVAEYEEDNDINPECPDHIAATTDVGTWAHRLGHL